MKGATVFKHQQILSADYKLNIKNELFSRQPSSLVRVHTNLNQRKNCCYINRLLVGEISNNGAGDFRDEF